MRQTYSSNSFVLFLLPVFLGGCGNLLMSPPSPDHRIKLIQREGETRTVPPKCVSWEEGWGNPLENEPWPSFGCAQARNLAAQIESPDDLIENRNLGPADPITSTAAIARYQSGQTAPLIDPNADNPEASKKMEDKRVGGAPQK